MAFASPCRVPNEQQPGSLATLKARMRALEQGRSEGPGRILRLGVAAIDRLLPGGGLAATRVHEVVGVSARDGAAAAFTLALIARLLSQTPGPVLWCGRYLDLHGPGLAAFGIDTARLILARTRDTTETLWAMEEGLRSARLAAVVGELTRSIDLTASRRLQLAAENGETTGLLLRPVDAGDGTPSAVETRWRVVSMLGAPATENLGVGRTAWRLGLERCRGGAQGEWMVELDDATGDLALAAAVCDRSARPAPFRLAV
ncbi:MAG: damage-inducible mutagenesis protein [Proteobacteria bacterium]|nr:damage-inducible mutagenesis protein [Pseudomonadota bacterium]MBI3497322.1 damage-inducible mutagenesis protein [Pseudomonadota bacterium]